MINKLLKTMGRALRHVSDPNAKRLFETILSNIDTLSEYIDEFRNPETYDWKDLVLDNGWVRHSDNYNPPQYAETRSGTVILRGMIKSGTATAGTVLFNLPKGLRPEYRNLIVVMSNSAAGRVDVTTDGNCQIHVGSNVWLSIDNISFQAFR